MAYAVNRLYRIITRLLGWLVGAVASILAIFLLCLAVYILFFDYPEHIKNWMEDEASRIMNREVRIEEFAVYLPNSFELRGLSALPQESDLPWLEFDRLRGELKLSGLLQRQVELSLLQVDGLTLRIQDYGGGRVDLPGLMGPPVSRPSGSADASFTFLASNIRFEDASFVYNNQNLPWYLEAADLIAQLERHESLGYRGRLSYERGELQIKDRPSFEGALDAQFELVGKGLRIVDVQAKGPFYSVQATGDVGFGAEPQAQIHLEVESRVTPAARSLLGLDELEDDGPTPARFTGELTMGRGWHQIEGEAEIATARFAGLPLRNWKGTFYWDRSLLEVTSARGSLAGGASELQIRQPLPADEHPTHIALELQDVPLQDFVRATVAEPGPLASDVSGMMRLDLPTEASQVLRGEFELTGSVPESWAQTQTGIDFSIGGEIDGGGVQIGRSRVTSDIADAELSGSYSWSESADFNLDLVLRDIARVDQIQQVFRTLLHPERPARLLNLAGRGRATGRLTGRVPGLAFDGDFQGTGVSFRTATFGDVEARGRWSKNSIRFVSAEARKDDATLRGTGEIALGVETSPDWVAEGEVHQWPVEELFELLRIPVPLRAKISAKGRYASHNGSWSGEGNASVGPGSFYAVGLDGAEAGVRLQGRKVILDPLSVTRNHAVVEGRFRFDKENGGIEGDFASKSFPIGGFSPQSMTLAGEMKAGLELSGTLEHPKAVFEAVIDSLGIDETTMGEARIEARVDGGAAKANLSIRGEDLALETESRTLLSAGYPTEGELSWRGADIGPWLHALPAGLPGSVHLVSDGEASFTGQASSFESWAGEAVMENIRLEVGGYQLTSSNPMTAALRRGTIQIEDLRLSGEDTQVTLSGSLPLEEGDLDLVAKGLVNLDILEGVYPSVSSSGQVELSGRVRGDWEHPSLSGYADLSSGVLRFQGFPQAFGDVRGRVSFDNRTIRFPNIEARFGGAPVTVSGTLLLQGLSPDSFELGLKGQGLRLRYPDGLVATLNTDLRMSGTPQSQILSGQIDVSEATWSREYDIATGILVRRDADLLEEIDEETPLRNLRFDVEVLMPGTLRIENSRATVDARAEIQLRGTFTQPALLGRMDAVRGELFLLGQRYKLVSGRVEFLDPSAIKPFFDLVAESRVRSYRVELRLTGTPERFFPELTSDPPLRTVDILRLLSGASERDILIGSEEEEIAGVGVASLLTERLSQEVGRRAERLFGLDRFSIDPFLVGQFANPTARVSVGKQIYRDLSVNYSTNLNAATETLILIEYTPEGPVTWLISRDEEGAWGVDLRFRKSF